MKQKGVLAATSCMIKRGGIEILCGDLGLAHYTYCCGVIWPNISAFITRDGAEQIEKL